MRKALGTLALGGLVLAGRPQAPPPPARAALRAQLVATIEGQLPDRRSS